MKIKFKEIEEDVFITSDLCYAHPEHDAIISVLLMNDLSLVSLDGEFDVVDTKEGEFDKEFFSVYHPSYKRMVLLPKWACEEIA